MAKEERRPAGHAIVLASSAKPDELQHYLSLLDAHEVGENPAATPLGS